MAVLSIGQVWAADATWSCIIGSGNNFGSATNVTTNPSGSKTLTGTVGSENVTKSWNFTMVSGTTKYYLSNTQIGSGTNYCTSVTLSTSAFTQTIKNVKVSSKCGSSATATITVKVGGTKYVDAASLSITETVYGLASNTGTSTGNIEISISQPSTKKAVYISKIEVIYDAGGDADPVLQSIAVSGTPSTDTYEEGNVFDVTGLIVTGTYDKGDDQTITEGITWEARTNSTSDAVALANYTLTQGQTALQVRATVGEIASAWTDVTGLTVNAHVVTPGTYAITPNTTFWGCSEINKSNATENEINFTGSQNDITITIKNGKKQNAYINSTQTRVYTDGYTMAFSVPTGYVIKAIAFTADGSNWAGTHTASVGTMKDNKNWEGSAQSVTITFGGTCRIAGISVTYAAIAPEVTATPSSLSFEAKQNITVDGKTFTLEGANLTSGLTLAASEGFTVSPTFLTAEAAMVEGGVEVTVTPATPTATTTPVEGTVTISGGGLTDNVVVNLSMTVTPTYLVAIAVNDGDMGSATLNGGTASIYVTDEEEIALVATPAEHHEFVNWTVSDENIILNNANAASTTAMAGAAGTITANFQAQACTGLAAPVLDAVTKDYQSATIAWNAVANASEGYEVNVYNDSEKTSTKASDLVTEGTSFAVSNLDAITTYYYTVMAVGDGTAYCAENNALLEGNFTTSDYPAATLSLVENGGEAYAWGGENLKMNDVIALPSALAGLGCSGKVLVGWSSVAVAETNEEPASNYWAKGAEYTLNAETQTLYAVLATEVDGTPATWQLTSTDITKLGSGTSYTDYDGNRTKSEITFATKDVMVGTGGNAGKIQLRANAGIIYNKTAFDADIVSIVVTDVNVGVFEGESEISSTPSSGAISATGSGPYTYTFSSGKRYFHLKKNSSGAGYVTSITVNLKGDVSYSGYTTSCEAQLPTLAAPTFPVAEGVFFVDSKNITINGPEGASIYYTINGDDPTSASTAYDAVNGITLNAYGEYTIKAIAVKAGNNDSEVAEATYAIGKEFASVSALFTYLTDNSLTSMNNVKVTGLVSRITTAWDAQKGYLTYYISDNGVAENDLQMYRGAGEGASALAVGDQVTVTGNYTLFQSTTHEFAAGNTIVARTAAVLESVAIGGAAEKTTYSPEDNQFSRTGLTATATYNTGYTKDVTALATWTNNLENNTVAASGNVEVTATYEGESDMKEVAVTYTSKTLDHITLSYSSTTAYVGMALPTPTVTASYVEDIDDEDVTELVAAANGFDTESAYNGSAAGSYTINVSYTLGEVTKSAEYTVTVKSIYNDESDPYTVAAALDIIGANFSTITSTDSIVVAGIVSRLDGTYVNTYWISDDGNTNNELEVYSGKYLNKVAFTAANQLHVGDVVVVKGKVKTYQSTKEFDSNSRLISVLREPEFAIADIVAGDEFEANVSEDMTVVPTVNSGDVEFTLTSGNEAVVTIENGKLHAVAEGDAEITATRAATNIANALNYKAKEITFNVHVIAERTRYTVTFDANGGEGDAPVIAAQLAGEDVELPENTFSKANSAFVAWVVTETESGNAVAVTEGHFTMPAAAVTIKATWNTVETCEISFYIGGTKVATANAPQTAEYTFTQVGAAVPGFTWVGWSKTEVSGEAEELPTIIASYTPEAGESSLTLYGIYSRLNDSDPNYGKYVKVAEAPANWAGQYLIVYEAGNLAFDGSLATLDATGNSIAVTIAENVVTGTTTANKTLDGSSFTIADAETNYSIRSASGHYIGCTGSSNGFNEHATTVYTNAISLDGITSSGGPKLQYLVSGEQSRFRYYKTTQKAVALYKKNVGYTVYTSSPVEKVTVTFDLAGGEGGCQTTKINKGGQLTICAEVPTKSHSEFAGWKNGDDVYEAGQAYTFNADITITAQWNTLQTYTITYDVNGSTDAAPTQEDLYAGDNLTLAAAVTKSGYTFKGWEYNNKLYKAGKTFTMPATNVTFVANWKKDAVATEKMTLVTDAAALVNGLEFALGCSYGENSFAMAGEFPSGKAYLASVSGSGISFDGTIASFTDDVIILIAEQAANGWKIRKDATNYLYSKANADLAWGTSAEATVWAISFSEGNVVIADGYENKIQFNTQNPRFKTYSSQTAIQMFSKATVVTADANISDLGNVDGETVVVTTGTTLTANEPSAPEALVIQEGAKYVAEAQTTTPVVHFSVTMGSENPAGDETTASELEKAFNIILTTGGEIHYDITLGTSMAGTQADPDQWHAFTVPFPCDALNGIYNAETGAKLTNEVDYAIMDYHGDIRANGQYGWKKFRGTLVPGTFYIMTVNGDVKTFRFKKVATGALPNNTSKDFTAYNGTGADGDQGWNGIGNPSWLGGKVNYNVQVLDPYSYTFVTKTANSTNFKPGTPFFYKASDNGTMNMLEANAGANYAPARTPANEIKNMAVRFGNEVFADKLYVTASEDALNSYENDKDLVKMIMSNTPKVAQIFGDAYGMKLSMVNTPLVNNNAEVALTLYAPEAGEYTISVPEMENAEIYLTKDGAIIWNLTMSEYTNDFAKGNNEGYGLLLIKKITGISTGVENVEAAEAGVQKVVIDNNVFILRGEKMYDVTGKMVK